MANGDLIQIWGTTNAGTLPSKVTDGVNGPVRIGKYGEQIIQPLAGGKVAALAEEGSYYAATNATAGTGIADTAALTGFVTTTPTMLVYNGNATGGKSIVLDSLRLQVTAAGTNGTNWGWAMYVDTGNRLTSGGTTITPVNVNIGSSNTTNAVVTFGAITAAAANAQRKIAAGTGRTVIKVIGDEYMFRFGDSSPQSTGMVLEGTAQVSRVFTVPPVVIPPGCSFLFYEWAASQSVAATFELNLNYWER